MGLYQTGDKPLSEPMMSRFTEAYMGSPASINRIYIDIPDNGYIELACAEPDMRCLMRVKSDDGDDDDDDDDYDDDDDDDNDDDDDDDDEDEDDDFL